MRTPYIIRIGAQKGGVGKTTIAVNLAVALKLMGYNTLLIDADSTNPSIGFHLGMENANMGTRAFATGKARIKDVVHVHAPTGLHVIPGVVSDKPYVPTAEQSRRFSKELRDSNYQFIIIDTQPGYMKADSMTRADLHLIVTMPNMESCASALRLAAEFDREGAKHSIGVNRIRNRAYELSLSEILEGYSGKVIGEFPEDESVPISIAEHIPSVLLNRRARFSKSAMRLAERIAIGLEPEQGRKTGGFFGWLLRLFQR